MKTLMPLVLSVVGVKGGIGKSTIALNLASCLHRRRRCLLVDSDAQATLRSWAATSAEKERSGPPVIGLDGPALRRDLAQVATGFEFVVIDGPPRLGVETRSAMMAADLVLLPVIPGAADIWALRETLALLEEARSVRPELEARVVLNRVDRTTLARITAEALVEMPVPVLRGSLGNRVAYGEATLAGRSVVDYGEDTAAQLEIRALAAEVTKLLGGAHGSQGRRAG